MAISERGTHHPVRSPRPGDRAIPADPRRRDDRAGPFRVLLTYRYFEPGFRAGGPVRAIAGLLDTCPEDVTVTMVTSDRDLGDSAPYPGLSGRWAQRGRSRVFYLDVTRPRQWWELWRTLRTERFDLMYVNSLWSTFSIASIIVARSGLIHAGRILVAPHGEFSPGALTLKARKKRAFLWFWQRFLRWGDTLWHATCAEEADLIRNALPWARVEVSANQVRLPGEPLAVASTGPTARLVFIGRISPKKNLALVLAALADLTTPVVLHAYGPVEDLDHWRHCQQLADRLPPSVTFEYRGEVPPDQVRDTFAGYDAFVFPTLGENFGYVIAESLSASCPVICSDQTPWNEVLDNGGGVVLRDLTVTDLARVLDRLAGAPPEERLRARQAAGDAYRAWWAALDRSNILDQVRARA
ncbi:glycosyltransferase [Micromonospora halophytica]|uniref:Glycosyltransferase involved in cell wall bisynthesis n=1 Tax=Micromonospora halophytica TaxID=47864 RepID=A0A1C5IRX2_9ACTN|nr:glycosyltransferase [Micromonospora halophytica]SCG60883.1 Glycosyltransferase involved in cell wall bisynthesis [Micromonospora halophytica]